MASGVHFQAFHATTPPSSSSATAGPPPAAVSHQLDITFVHHTSSRRSLHHTGTARARFASSFLRESSRRLATRPSGIRNCVHAPTSRLQPVGEPNRSRLRRCHSVTLPPATLSAARVPNDSVATALVKCPCLLRTQQRVDIGADMSRFSTACRLFAAHGIRSHPDASLDATSGTHASPPQHLVSKCVCLCTLDGRLRCTPLCTVGLLHRA